MTQDQTVLLAHWSRFGGHSFVRKVKSGWCVSCDNPDWAKLIGNIPVVFKTKTLAVNFIDDLLLARAHEWRGYQHEQLATEQMSTSSYPAPKLDPAYMTDVFYGC